jgi:hypothetical protein
LNPLDRLELHLPGVSLREDALQEPVRPPGIPPIWRAANEDAHSASFDAA